MDAISNKIGRDCDCEYLLTSQPHERRLVNEIRFGPSGSKNPFAQTGCVKSGAASKGRRDQEQGGTAAGTAGATGAGIAAEPRLRERRR